ncbi:MAG: methyltransferase domain-containing protein [Chloroflexi bacterium]|nr:methyltransferase domain-containing protein [Chloroflexota bacterium]
MAVTLGANAYDALAPDYDAQLAQNPVAVWMRAILWEHFVSVFPPRGRILDLTAGTGADACFLAARGFRVTALDASAGMIVELEKNATRRGLQIDARVLAAEHLSELDVRDFDGVISTFAGLNTIENLPTLARELTTCVRPRGRVIVHALGEFCLWESVANLLRHRGRRDGTMRVGAASVAHRLYNPYTLWRDTFAPNFELRQVYGLSLIVAPALVKRVPTLAPALFRADLVLGNLFPAAGDFFVLDLERRDEGSYTEQRPDELCGSNGGDETRQV